MTSSYNDTNSMIINGKVATKKILVKFYLFGSINKRSELIYCLLHDVFFPYNQKFLFILVRCNGAEIRYIDYE